MRCINIFLLLFLFLAPIRAEELVFEELEEVKGFHLKVIAVALTKFSELEYDLEDYNVGLYDRGQFYSVHFFDPNDDPGRFGSSPKVKEFSILIKKKNLVFDKIVFSR